MVKNKYSSEQKTIWLNQWRETKLSTGEFAKSINIKPTLLYQWRAAEKKNNKQKRNLPTTTHQTILVNKPTKNKYKVNYCCNCGCPVMIMDVAINYENE